MRTVDSNFHYIDISLQSMAMLYEASQHLNICGEDVEKLETLNEQMRKCQRFNLSVEIPTLL